MSLFSDVTLAPADPILGLNDAFKADSRAEKINLGVGVYLDEKGKLPLLECVQAAEAALEPKPWSYQPIDGNPDYNKAVQKVVFGDSPAIADGRIVTVQSLGGTGALKIGADLLAQINPKAKVLISNPSWENHRALFARAGYQVANYRYYDPEAKAIDFDGMLADIKAAEAGTIVVLHACCHNPTGYDLSPQQWDQVVSVIAENNLVAFLDMAYQGFGLGLAEDSAAINKFVDAGLSFFVSNSFSKTFSLYGERVGGLSIVTSSAEEARRVLSQTKIMIRTIYSNPPTHGAALVSKVLNDATLRTQWENELGAMRTRINSLRTDLVAGLAKAGISDMGFIADQKGMFSYSGLTKDQMVKLRDEYAIYGLDSGRICVAGLNDDNLTTVIDAIVKVRS
ncbi:MAG: aromatic amino acid aminotransferase [Actinomycetales bacterium]|nr:MAG: aromatic amino acid aminotransferase [Actinomycetales bacterium]